MFMFMWPGKTISVSSKPTRRCNKNHHLWILSVLFWIFLLFVVLNQNIYTAIISQSSVEKTVRRDEEFFETKIGYDQQQQQQPVIITTIWKDVLGYQEATLSHLCKSQQQGQILIICIECGEHASSKLEQKLQREPCKEKMRAIYYPPKSPPPQQVSEFKKWYIHFSLNPEPYEMFCFTRHLYILEALKQNHINSAFIVDSDMVFFDSLTNLLKPYSMHGTSSVTLVEYSIFLVYWNSTRIYSQFAEYMINVYRHKTMDQVAEFIRTHVEQTDYMFRIPESYPTPTLRGQLVPKFSDMELFQIFLKEHPSSSMRFLCPFVAPADSQSLLKQRSCPLELVSLVSTKFAMDCSIDDANSNMGEEKDDQTQQQVNITSGLVSWVFDHRFQGHRPLVNGTNTLLFGMHLQGPKCKKKYLNSNYILP